MLNTSFGIKPRTFCIGFIVAQYVLSVVLIGTFIQLFSRASSASYTTRVQRVYKVLALSSVVNVFSTFVIFYFKDIGHIEHLALLITYFTGTLLVAGFKNFQLVKHPLMTCEFSRRTLVIMVLSLLLAFPSEKFLMHLVYNKEMLAEYESKKTNCISLMPVFVFSFLHAIIHYLFSLYPAFMFCSFELETDLMSTLAIQTVSIFDLLFIFLPAVIILRMTVEIRSIPLECDPDFILTVVTSIYAIYTCLVYGCLARRNMRPRIEAALQQETENPPTYDQIFHQQASPLIEEGVPRSEVATSIEMNEISSQNEAETTDS